MVSISERSWDRLFIQFVTSRDPKELTGRSFIMYLEQRFNCSYAGTTDDSLRLAFTDENAVKFRLNHSDIEIIKVTNT